MDWDPEVRAKLKKLRELREEASLREQQRTAALRPVSQSMAPEIKMVVGDWYTDELGNQARMIYNAKTVDFETPYAFIAGFFASVTFSDQRRYGAAAYACLKLSPARGLLAITRARSHSMIRRPRILTNTALTDRAGDRQELGVLLGIQLICEGVALSSLAWQVLISEELVPGGPVLPAAIGVPTRRSKAGEARTDARFICCVVHCGTHHVGLTP